jgi:outer membrane protein assembly factor BamB
MKRSWLTLPVVLVVMLGGLLAAGSLVVPGTSASAQEKSPGGVARSAPKSLVDPLDWPYWRGPEYNSISRETGLPDTISLDPKEKNGPRWVKPEAAGRGTPIVMRGKLYTLCRHNPSTSTEQEKVLCLDAATGETIWENKFNVWSSDVPNTRVGWSSVCGDPDTGYVYALGVCGLFQCIDGETGKTIWSLPLHERLGLLSTYGGRTNYPIVVDDLVILGSVIIGWGDMAIPAQRYFAFDKLTGEVRWFVSTRLRPEDTIYSAPVVAVLNGQKVVVVGSGDGYVYGFQPQTGKTVFEYLLSRRGLNASPTVVGDKIYVGHSEENPTGTQMGAVVCLDGTQTGKLTDKAEIWKELELGVGRSAPLVVDDRVYCFDDTGKLIVVNAKTGEPIGRKVDVGTTNFASPLFADGKVYHLEKARWFVLTPDERRGAKGAEPRSKGTNGMFPAGDEAWSSPIVSHGRLYFQTTGALYCFEDKAKEKGAAERPPLAEIKPVDDDPKPAQLQVVPCEILMKPGEKQQLTVRLFNSRGQFLKEEKAEFELAGASGGKPVGAIDESGVFTAPDDAAHVATIVRAKVGDLTGRARIRIVPPLPWSFDFEGLADAPITWVGARYRHVMREVDGSNVMVKITTIPKGTRSRLSMGHSDEHDYTIQCDFKAATQDNKLPDVGLIAQGYTMAIESLNQRILLNSWGSHEHRFDQQIPFTLEPDVWYTIKLRAENSAGKAVLRGKVWKRGQDEPADWSIELVDPLPNVKGSPGLFGNATNAELYLDNVTVVPNT